mgnify:CR=1 FL=1
MAQENTGTCHYILRQYSAFDKKIIHRFIHFVETEFLIVLRIVLLSVMEQLFAIAQLFRRRPYIRA